MALKQRHGDDTTLISDPGDHDPAVPDEAPVSDEDAARELRNRSRQLREQAGQVTRDARAAYVAAERGVQDANREARELHAQAGGIEQRAALLDRRVVLAGQADRLDAQAADGERELARILDEHGRLTHDFDDLDARLADLRAHAEEASSGLISATAAGDGPAVASFRLRVRAVEEVRADVAGRREAAAGRLAAVAAGGEARVWAERNVAGIRARRDKILNELDPGLLARRGDVHRHVERLAGADVEAQIEAVAGLLASGS
ncbi:MAG TPA: hypothetical protein VK547_09720 [Candidatus Udaeobacter sp.]|nr:hypothetical protein [Candidatus Udaeobacter sp.]